MISFSSGTIFVPMTPDLRRRLEVAVEQMIALLDEVDGDPGFEPGVDDENGRDVEPDQFGYR